MNKNIDLTKILKDCPKGTKFYCTLCGYVTVEIGENYYNTPIAVYGKRSKYESSSLQCRLSKFGRYDKNVDGECLLFPSKEQRDWSKFAAPWYKKEKFDTKMVKPKFNVGDRIRHKETNRDDVYEISKVYDDSYGIAGFTWMIYMEYQDQYELVLNKFEPKTLKPFDKVLVRDNHYQDWTCGFFSHTFVFDNVCKYNVGEILYKMCIPYNDETKHLVGKNDEAPEYYRYWEE